MAGFTLVRDLGTEGAAFDDVGLKQAIEKGDYSRPTDDRCYEGYCCQRKLWTKPA
jgi:hypothetical protein